MEFQLTYFKSWKMMLWKCCTQDASKFGKQQWPQDWKRSVFISIPKKGNAKECSNYRTVAVISHTSKVMLKILQARLQQYGNRELPEVQAGLEKAEEPEIKLPTSAGSWKKTKRVPEKHLLLLYWLCQNLWLCGSQQTVENSLRDGYARPPDLPPEKPVCRSRSQQLVQDLGQWTGSKLGKEYVKAVYCHPAYLTYMPSLGSHRVRRD